MSDSIMNASVGDPFFGPPDAWGAGSGHSRATDDIRPTCTPPHYLYHPFNPLGCSS